MPRKSYSPTRRLRLFHPVWKAVKRAWRHIAAPADRGYMICTTPRCGSNYLSQLVASTGVLGNPREYFNVEGRRRNDDPEYPDDPCEQLKQVLTTGRTANGIYAVKMHYYQLAALKQIVDPFRDLPHLHYIVLKRRDVLGQALSWSRALQTGQFRATHTAWQAATYDQRQIRQSLVWLMDERASWRKTLRTLKARPLVLTYETVMGDPQRAVDRVAAFMALGRSPRIDPALVTVSVQRDKTTDDWRARFLAETGGEFQHLADPAPDHRRLARGPESD
jgi:trehalose 2-sulfotransferase